MKEFTLTPQGCYFPKLPFYWRPLTPETKNLFPATLPFELMVDEQTGVVQQKPNDAIVNILAKSYCEGTYIEGLMEKDGIGRAYADDFINFIDRVISLKNLAGKKVLEIGCGTGYLLNEMQQHGAQVLGYEPGFANIGKFNVPVINQFFPSPEVEGQRFDVIIAFGVLEHIDSPADFLRILQAYLKPDGILIISVPDCQSQIEQGDLAMLIHEHFSYFTLASLTFFMQSNQFSLKRATKSGFGGSLYVACEQAPKEITMDFNVGSLEAPVELFHRIDERLKLLGKFISSMPNATLGIYVPMRAFNALFLLKDVLAQHQVTLRFFDDARALQGCFCPGFDIPIESRASLVANPCDHILIFSYTFAEAIRKQIKPLLPPGAHIYSLAEL